MIIPSGTRRTLLARMIAACFCAVVLLLSAVGYAADIEKLYQTWTREQQRNPPIAAKAAADYIRIAPSADHARDLSAWLINYDELAPKVGFPLYKITPVSIPAASSPSPDQLYQTWEDQHTKDQKVAARAAAGYLGAAPSGDHREEVREWLNAYNSNASMSGFPVVAVPAETAATPDETTAMLTPPVTQSVIPRPPIKTVEKRFRDCPECPEMMSLPTGSFTMGSADSEAGRFSSEGPQHNVMISRRIAMGVYDVTFDEWNACLLGGGCGGYTPSDEGWGTGNHPVVNVSWNDAQAYVEWLNQTTGQHYRLPSEAEWEYAARATTETPYFWGDEASSQYAVYAANGTLPVGSTLPNKWGLYDMLGNVSQWTADCYNPDYTSAPIDGSARTYGDCKQRMFRGGAWLNKAAQVRAASRNWADAGGRFDDRGFRVVRDLQ